MRTNFDNTVLWTILILGIVLRLIDLHVPDMTTDEAQFVLGASAAQPPVGMALFRAVQTVFGSHILVSRSVSVLLGILTIPAFYALARCVVDKRTALLATAVASIVPSHVLFSRLAYLSVPLCLAWILTTLAFLKARETKHSKWLLALFAASVIATLTKTQGLLIPGLLLFGRIIETRHRCIKDEICWVLGLSLIPIGLTILTDPGIPATLLLYGGSMYGFSDFVSRIATLHNVWWTLLPIFFLAAIFSFSYIRRLGWPLWILLAVSTLIGLVLGPNHEYYATYLIIWALPIGIMLSQVSTRRRRTALAVLFFSAIAVLSPLSPWTHRLYKEPGYWNTHAQEMNTILADEEQVIAVGFAGHHIRWYLEPRVLVGNDMDLSQRSGLFVLLNKDRRDRIGKAEVLYEDERTVVLRK